VIVLAGAGSGKTTTITRRIANQVLTGTFVPQQILAVTFTRKAAGELRERLATLGVQGVVAGTFHGAAQRQIGYFADERRQVVSNKFGLLGPIARNLPESYRQRPLTDLAGEIEWARNRRLTPDSYLDNLGSHEPPIPAELMQRVFVGYETAKERANSIDHEDQLELAVRVFEANPAAGEEFRARYRAFTVDEFQDVNLLQWSLLEQWLGGRDDLCAVGDDYQAIYGFTGATPDYLLSLPRRFPTAPVIRLEQNYRSSPEILETANRLAHTLGVGAKNLVAVKPSGPAPRVRAFDSYTDEAAAIAARCHELHTRGIPLREIAVLYRVNFRSALFEEALIAEGLPFDVHGGAFLERRAANQLLPACVHGRAQPPQRPCAKRQYARVGMKNPPSSLGLPSKHGRPISVASSRSPPRPRGTLRASSLCSRSASARSVNGTPSS
jgi:DNA helicase-2/ATP-dependent DNA helicase PcrA